MDTQRILDELLALLQVNNVTVRSEPLGGSGGGLCTMKDKKIFFVDTQSSSAEMAAKCAQAVSKIADLESLYILPEVREFIENHTVSERG